MFQDSEAGICRRRFLGMVAPACALTCLGFETACAQEKTETSAEGGTSPRISHPFDAKFGRELTYRQFYKVRYAEAIKLAKALQDEMGREEALDFLRLHTSRTMSEFGKSQAAKIENPSLHRYTEQFRNLDNYRNTLAMQIVEDTDRVFELKVTECIWASTFLAADAGELGYAMVCYGDYAWAEGFNSRIKLERDKTLMEGHAICNHRYVWLG